MAIDVGNDGFLSDIILLTHRYYHQRGTRLNAMKRFCPPMTLPKKRFDNFSYLTGGCSEGLLIHT